MHSARPLLYVERTVRAFYNTGIHAIVPWKHYIPVKADLKDLDEKAAWIVDHPAEAKRIGWTAQAHARLFFTHSAVIAAMRHLILETPNITVNTTMHTK